MSTAILAAAAISSLLSSAEWIGTDKVSVAERCGKLEFSITATREDGVQKVLLRSPARVPEGQELFYDLVSSQISAAKFCALVRDAKGREFLLKQRSIAMLEGGSRFSFGTNLIGGRFRFGGLDELGQVRVRVPAMSNAKRETYLAQDGMPGKPAAPLSFIGFTIHVEAQGKHPRAGHTEYWMDNFSFAPADAVADPFVAMFKGNLYFGRADAAPEIFIGDVIQHPQGTRHELSWELRDRYDGPAVKKGELVVEFKESVERPYKLNFGKSARLPRMPEGTYWVKIHARSGYDAAKGTWRLEREIDERYDVVRNTSAPPASAKALPKVEMPVVAEPFRFPDGVPTWRDIRDGDKPMVLFAPMVNKAPLWREAYAHLFDEMVKSGDSRQAEIQNRWSACEPMPGKFDFSWVLGPLDEAAKRGCKCFVTFAPMDVPEWMPSIFTKNDRGEVYGHNAYLFHGGRINLFQSRYVRDRSFAYLTALVLAVRNHPACLGYFYITEHSGEAPWAEWYEGFDDETIGNFRKVSRRRYGTIKAANAAWRTSFRSFDAVRPPAHDDECSLAFRRDWLVFRRTVVHKYIAKCVETIRKLDDKRIIMCYGDGILYSRADEIARHGVITANGGCAVPETIFARRLVADVNLPQRAEEISCSNWKAKGETQVDMSVFAMLGGGGANTHFKMFTPECAPFQDLRKGIRGLDRLELFLPILRELRAARPLPADFRVWSAFEGPTAESRIMNGGDRTPSGWTARFLLDSQVVPGMTTGQRDWSGTRFVMAPPELRTASRREAEELVEYARGGGTLFISAEVARKVVEDESEDWWLLRRLGFAAPASELRGARPVISGLGGCEARVRAALVPAGDFGEVLMKTEGGQPALTEKAFGKGRVIVLWASELIPYFEGGIPDAKPFLPKLLARAGVRSRVSTQSRLHWVNLLRKDDDTWYLLTTCAPAAHSQARPDAAPKDDRWFKVDLPGGMWEIRDLVSGETRPAMKADELRERGFDDHLDNWQVRVWRLNRKGDGQ